jgi:hypothetical protein
VTLKRYGGYPLSAIEEFVAASEEREESIDFISGDDATSALIIKDLIAEIRTRDAKDAKGKKK